MTTVITQLWPWAYSLTSQVSFSIAVKLGDSNSTDLVGLLQEAPPGLGTQRTCVGHDFHLLGGPGVRWPTMSEPLLPTTPSLPGRGAVLSQADTCQVSWGGGAGPTALAATGLASPPRCAPSALWAALGSRLLTLPVSGSVSPQLCRRRPV